MKSVAQFVHDIHALQVNNDLTNAQVATAASAVLVASCLRAGLDPLDLVRKAQIEVATQLIATGAKSSLGAT
jgi:hypothetical protein